MIFNFCMFVDDLSNHKKCVPSIHNIIYLKVYWSYVSFILLQYIIDQDEWINWVDFFSKTINSKLQHGYTYTTQLLASDLKIIPEN